MKPPIRDLFLQFRFVAKGALQGAILTNTKVHLKSKFPFGGCTLA